MRVQPPTECNDTIVVGNVSGLYGVKGWVKVSSWCDPLEQIVDYGNWQLRKRGTTEPFTVETGKAHGKGVIAKLVGVDDRDQAAKLVGAEIMIRRDQLAQLGDDEYYWADLVGLSVVTEAGDMLGKIESMLETGANDVMVVGGEKRRLIPFLRGTVVRNINLDTGRIVVDWDPEF